MARVLVRWGTVVARPRLDQFTSRSNLSRPRRPESFNRLSPDSREAYGPSAVSVQAD